MSSELSDDDFCETNFCEPSPHKRINILPSAKQRNEEQMKKEELRKRIFKTERECFDVICNSLKVKEDEPEKIIQYSSEDVLFSPPSRNFFEYQEISKDNLQPFLWLGPSSQFYEMSLEEFIFNLTQVQLTNNENEEKSSIIKFCLNIVLQEKDPVKMRLLVHLLSKHVITYDLFDFKSLGGPNISYLICLISKSVPKYSSAEAKELFRQACLAALDAKTFSMTSELMTMISECLVVSAVQNKVMEEVDWLISLDLKPEEGFRIIEVLPNSGLYGDLSSYFAWKFLPTILGLKYSHLEDQTISWRNLVKFLKENEIKIKTLAPNFYFCFMYITMFIVIRIPDNDSHSVKVMLNVVDGLKLHFCQEKGNMSHYLSIEALNRLYLICNELLKSKKK